MHRRLAFALTAAPFGLLGALLNPRAPLGHRLFGDVQLDGADPSGIQMGLLVLVAIVEVAGFTFGGLFLVRGWGLTQRYIPSPRLARAAHFAIVWSLMSWVPHGALHQTNGHDLWRLIAIEYAFHVTLIASAAILAISVVAVCRIRTTNERLPSQSGLGQSPVA